MEKWLKMSAADLGRAIGKGEIDPVALCDTYLKAIEAHPLRDRIYARVTADRARSEAAAASRRAASGHRLSPLDGVPISWKDLFDTAGTVTEAGTKLLEGRLPDRDARVLANATAMGLVCLGKTHLSELAFSGLGYNPSTATPPCVNDDAAVSGGSSSGAATSVAFGLAAAAIGSDTGGSVRIPAAWNDLVGLKTTATRLSLEGVVPLAYNFDTIGPLCRTVEDANLLLAVMEGRKAVDLGHAPLKGLHFGILKTIAFDDIEEAPRRAFDEGVDKLREAGVTFEEVDLESVTEAMPLSSCLFTSEAYGLWRETIEANPDVMFSEVLGRFRIGKDYDAADYFSAWHRLKQLRADYAAATARFDAVVLPTAPILPPQQERLTTDSDYYVKSNLMTLRNTRIGNLMGLAVLTLPTSVPSCGFMLMGRAMGEARLLRVGAAVEEALTDT
ncbi:MAG: amidase [Sulfitobacter sp.]|nr:amidase [Sulfitobacter sp.]